MRELTMAEVQKKAVDILVYIDKICRENNLKYTIFYGSLIGVERHQGFIPWDDDIDIVMPRPDYEELLLILKNDTNFPALFLQNTKMCVGRIVCYTLLQTISFLKNTRDSPSLSKRITKKYIFC